MKFLLCIVLFITGSLAHAQLVDDGLSPYERHTHGFQISGAYNASNVLYCSAEAKAKHIPQALSNDTVLKALTSGHFVTVDQEITDINNVISRALQTLSFFGDAKTQNRYVCVGFYQDKGNHMGNALSLVHGYLIFDYKLIENLYALPDDKRTFWVQNFLILHEFAHQLQYWNNDEEVLKTLKGEQSSKKPELAADCTAAALLKLMNLGLPQEVYDLSFKGVIGAAELLGDFDKESPSHHGTPVERQFAASYGSGYISQLQNDLSMGRITVSSQSILRECNKFVNENLY